MRPAALPAVANLFFTTRKEIGIKVLVRVALSRNLTNKC